MTPPECGAGRDTHTTIRFGALGRDSINGGIEGLLLGAACGDKPTEVSAGLKEVCQTKNDVLLMTSSGTGAMESAVANLMAPGETAIVGSSGAFGDRWAKLLEAYGANSASEQAVLRVLKMKALLGMFAQGRGIKESAVRKKVMWATVMKRFIQQAAQRSLAPAA